jgi:hypothetical protein
MSTNERRKYLKNQNINSGAEVIMDDAKFAKGRNGMKARYSNT